MGLAIFLGVEWSGAWVRKHRKPNHFTEVVRFSSSAPRPWTSKSQTETAERKPELGACVGSSRKRTGRLRPSDAATRLVTVPLYETTCANTEIGDPLLSIQLLGAIGTSLMQSSSIRILSSSP